MQAIDLKNTQFQAEQGDLSAQVQVGKYRLGQERYEEAAGWFRKAAEQGAPEAQFLLASMLSEGLGIDQDAEQAAYFLRQAAEQGHQGAQVLLAESFESGVGVALSHSHAAQWYLKAAQQGDNLARLRYGHLLRIGHGVDRSLPEAINWLKLAADAGLAEAQVELGECFLEQEPPDVHAAIVCGKAAADQGSADGEFLLGHCYELLPDPEKNIEPAISWYKVAAEHGSTKAQLRLAKLYAEGQVVARDTEEAEKWLQLVVAGEQAVAEVNAPQATGGAAGLKSLEPTPGTTIDNKYFIVSIIGKGGMCKVFKAKHMQMNRMVALKMLLPELAIQEELVERFRREAQAASALSHPNVITMYDLGTTADGAPFIVMDYLEGESLEERIETQGYIPMDQFMAIFDQLCAALEHAHEAGIVHRDIKPSNIMLVNTKNKTDVVKVVDFGLAKLLDPQSADRKLTKTGQVPGTLLYMSPEQCLGHSLDERTDVYSVGCTMYEAITGQPPFSGNTPYELMSKQVREQPESVRKVAPHVNVPDELEAVIMKALAKNREDRHQTMSELRDALKKL